MSIYQLSAESFQEQHLLSPYQKLYFFEQDLHLQDSPQLYDFIIDENQNFECLPLLTVIRYDKELLTGQDQQDSFYKGYNRNIIDKLINLNNYLDYPQQNHRNQRIIKMKDCTRLMDFQDDYQSNIKQQDLLQKFIKMISTIQKNQYNQKFNSTLILVQGELNTFHKAYIQLFKEKQKYQKNVFINLTGFDTKENILQMKDISQTQNNIYVSFVVKDLSLLDYNNPDEGIYIIPISSDSKHYEIEFLFHEYFDEIIENPEFIFLQLGINQELQIHQYIIQNLINKLDTISFKKLIIQLQFMNNNEILAQQLLQQYLQIYQAIVQGLQRCAPIQTLPNIFTNEDQRKSIDYILGNLKKQQRISRILKQYQRECTQIDEFKIQQLQTNQTDKIKFDKKFSTYIQHRQYIVEVFLSYKKQTFQNKNTQEYINNEEQIIFYSNLCQIDDIKEEFTYIDCYTQYNMQEIELSITDGIGQASNQQDYELQIIKWKKTKTNSLYYIKNKKIYKIYEQNDQDYIEVFHIETKQINILTREFVIPKNIDYYKDLDKKDQKFLQMRIGGTCIDGPNDSILIIGGISKEEPKILNVIEYIQTWENEFYSAKFKKQVLKIDQQMTFYPFQSNIVLKNNNQILILAQTKSNTSYQFYYNQSSLKKAFLLIFEEEFKFLPLTLEQDTNYDLYTYHEKNYNQTFLKDQNCWLLASKKLLVNIDMNKIFKSQKQITDFINQQNIIQKGKLIQIDDSKSKSSDEYADYDVLSNFQNDDPIANDHALLQQLIVLSKIYLDQENKKVFVKTECFRLQYKQYRITLNKKNDILEK